MAKKEKSAVRILERVTGDDDVGHAVVERDAVERRVRLDDPPMRLRGQPRTNLVRVDEVPVEPGRQLGEWRRETRRLVDEEQADHLHPGRAALRPRAHDDVTGAVLEAFPPLAALGRVLPHAGPPTSTSAR